MKWEMYDGLHPLNKRLIQDRFQKESLEFLEFLLEIQLKHINIFDIVLELLLIQ